MTPIVETTRKPMPTRAEAVGDGIILFSAIVGIPIAIAILAEEGAKYLCQHPELNNLFQNLVAQSTCQHIIK